ncbi:hypothetical protein [Streptococcus sp. S784/96/1]|uniref:hypothetical protein n=1 Tax=Streptococcus sp. S784/96/1 TaxID=2653499 RepID=UPI001386D369|nr:hypothetical protein [Streptococcus sp. S784/96/1]
MATFKKVIVDIIEPKILEQQLKTFVLLDVILVPKEEEWLRSYTKIPSLPYYLYDTGSGDYLSIRFFEEGVIIKGFDHKNELSVFTLEDQNSTFVKSMYHDVPEHLLSSFTQEELLETTFCIWYDKTTNCWYQNEHPTNDGGKNWLLSNLIHTAELWLEWAEAYYEFELDKATVTELFNGLPASESRIAKLVPDANYQAILKEISDLV